MKRFLFILLALVPLFANAQPATELTGRYVLQGVRETDSTLLLKDEGRFEATFAYGNLDRHIQGRWQRTEDTVVLTAESNSDVAELFKNVPLTVGEHCLIRDMGDHKACYLRQPQLPYKAWHLGFFTPEHMDIWLETADVTDIRGITFTQAMSGTVSSTGEVSGWPAIVAMGSGRHMNRQDLPERIFIRWQSLAEPQTYRATLEIPESARNLMRQEERVDCPMGGWQSAYRDSVVIGLAPGGIAKLWVSGPCFKGTEILRVQAEIEPKGPYQGLSEGRHRPLEPAAKAYIEQHGIPYDSW
ncbi:MAG: DUF2931 family protein [Gammaproteobacteria bacterium]|nr:DUF2931 family protein [Gammaproteobacteria bacterium]MBU2138522.1 DUF2931 family protein [Gammaproteobacteria bacterium]MBU2322533.1 DUF2931 family protein [Gammaproteobacteria bacterium]